MFDLERWQEIFDTIRKNKLRTFLTGLSVASGIFILVILLGFGQGMQNGVAKEFSEDASNRIIVWTRTTTKEYKGLNPGRRIQLRNENNEYVQEQFKEDIARKSAIYRVGGSTVVFENENLGYSVQGISPGFQFIENQFISSGRYINELDEKEAKKVAIIGRKIAREIGKSYEEIVDNYLDISGIRFKIVGVYTDGGGDREEDRIFIPITTAQRVFNGADKVNNLTFTLSPSENFEASVEQSKIFTNNLKNYLKEAHMVSPEDNSAINAFNTLEESKRYFGLIGNIKFFFWFVGICTIIAGVVGVSNIMLIVVKERTKEIGIRKALGAKPWAIIGMILHESIFITAISGFTGLIFSMGLLELIGPHVEVDYVVNPSVNFSVAMSTVILLIISGAIAGFFPAYRAANIHTIEALRDE
ncbi:ABC transporter permease [Eudoraea chungangensis]|uniref:ABC transporter permease n=1 Tax=Eudoraea chungangensis TaxID=1481905 RepID=UPI0023EC40A7|nr:ABC transporter permease [Eudoraea chungangensis]